MKLEMGEYLAYFVPNIYFRQNHSLTGGEAAHSAGGTRHPINVRSWMSWHLLLCGLFHPDNLSGFDGAFISPTRLQEQLQVETTGLVTYVLKKASAYPPKLRGRKHEKHCT